MIKKIDKFKKNNPGIAVNVSFSNKKSQKKNIYTVCRSGRNAKCKKQVNLLMIVNGEKRHYTAIKNISRLLSKLNGKSSRRISLLHKLFEWFLNGVIQRQII